MDEKGRTDTHGTEVATEDGLPEGLNVRNPLIESDDNWQASEEQDEDGDDDQSPDSNAEDRVVEVVEGCPSSNVDETSNVEEKIDDGTEHGLFGLSVEETIPGKCGTTTKGGEEIVSTKHGAGADHQKSEGNILGNV